MELIYIILAILAGMVILHMIFKAAKTIIVIGILLVAGFFFFGYDGFTDNVVLTGKSFEEMPEDKLDDVVEEVKEIKDKGMEKFDQNKTFSPED